MRNDVHEPAMLKTNSGSRRERGRGAEALTPAALALHPHAVDAALADDTMPMLTERGSRRDLVPGRDGVEAPKRLVDGPHEIAPAMERDERDGLLRSLAAQLDILNWQQQEIRIMLDQAGRRRVDHAGR